MYDAIADYKMFIQCMMQSLSWQGAKFTHVYWMYDAMAELAECQYHVYSLYEAIHDLAKCQIYRFI